MILSEARLRELIEARLRPGSDVPAIDAEIDARYGEDWAILVSDMSGFSSRTARYGIIHFLAMIHQMHSLALPLLEAHRGLLLKTEADNLYLLFSSPEDALSYAFAANRACAEYNQARGPDEQLHVCQGLGYGRVLRVGEHDIFGLEMNIASRLGEDLARAGEILLSEAAFSALKQLPEVLFERRQGELFSGGVLAYYTARRA